jgi:hypothetical protein
MAGAGTPDRIYSRLEAHRLFRPLPAAWCVFTIAT